MKQGSNQQQEAPLQSGTRDLLQAIAAHLDDDDDDTLNFENTPAEQVAAQFDVSPFRLWLLFKSVDTDNDGYVSKDELVECLVEEDEQKQSQLRESCEPLQQLWDMLVSDEDTKEEEKEKKKREEISYAQFCRLIRYLWLQQLLRSEMEGRACSSDYTFDCIDYAGSYFELKHIPGYSINAETRRFFTVPRHPQARMRWIDIPPGPCSRITILRLAVKYRFHPTSVEDAIDLELQEPDIDSFEHSLLDLGDFSMDSLMWLRHGSSTGEAQDDGSGGEGRSTAGGAEMPLPVPRMRKSRSQIDNDSFGSDYGSNYSVYEEADVTKGHGLHYFITMPMFELTERSQRSLELFLSFEKNPASRRHSLKAASGQSEQQLIIEIKEATLGIFVASKPHPNLVVTVSTKWRPTRIRPLSSTSSDEEPETSASTTFNKTTTSLEGIKRLLQKRHSLQRHGNSDWLLHAILDAIVDNLRPISNIYEAKIKLLSTRLLELGHRLSTREVKEIIVMKRDLEWLQHELRPMLIVLRHLIGDRNIGVDVTHYLEDIEDHMNLLIDELSSYARESEAMRDEFNSYSDRRMNDVLYLLTLVTTIFVPAQFFTGYFGMNFIDNDTGEPALALLNLGWKGLVSFWIMTLFTTILIILVMYHYRWFERPREA